MVNSRFEYVKEFEREDQLLPDTYILVEIRGRHFKDFCSQHQVAHPFDDRLTRLMAAAARATMEDFADVDISFGYSDRFYLVFSRTTSTFNRRRDKIVSTVVSLFVSSFVYKWKEFFDIPMIEPPEFTGKITLFPRRRTVIEFLISEQLRAASHCISEYMSAVATRAGAPLDALPENFVDQNEFLFHHGINFNSLPPWHKRGKILFREKRIYESSDDLAANKPDFWKKHAKILKR